MSYCMRCVTRVTAPACFGVISSFTKTGAVLRTQKTRWLYFSFTLKTLQLHSLLKFKALELHITTIPE